jgi:PAS domain S-box-containing protein
MLELKTMATEKENQVKILMVDDLPENLFALDLILLSEKYLCIKANSGNEALKILLHEQDFAIILIDVQMPEMDGFETVELIREIDAMKHVPIIYLTASMDSTSQIFKGYQAGAVDYMIKPLIPEILKAKVAVFVDLYKKTQELKLQKEQVKSLYGDVTAEKLISKYSLSLIEASHDPLFAINSRGKVTDLNDASVKVTGLSRKKLLSTEFADYFTDPHRAREICREAFEKGSVSGSSLTLRHKDGKLVDVLFNGSVYKDENGKVLGVAIVGRDVTDQKRVASELMEAKIAAELATKIAEEAMRKSEKASRVAEHAVKAKQQFLSNMSHEIRTPLNGIIGFTKILLRNEMSEKQKPRLEAIKTSSDILLVLINDILDLAKIEAGKLDIEQTEFKLSDLLNTVLGSFEFLFREKELKIIKRYDDKLPAALIGDPVRINQILINLLSNAVKFTGNGGRLEVEVKLVGQDESHAEVVFNISDTGIGIPVDKQETIFQAFEQSNSDTARKYGGTGLGLNIVKRLVELMGGAVSVKSKLGKGSIFTVRLPFMKSISNGVNTEPDTQHHAHELQRLGKLKILLAEDIPINQFLAQTILRDFGFETDTADNGKIAIELLKKNQYDIILMDLMMPEMDGFEATQHIRTKMAPPKSIIPIIALTADVTKTDVDECKAVGMDDYVSKPIDERDLLNKIARLVQINNQ